MPVIPDDTFTLSFLFLRYLFNTKWCISNVVKRFRWILGAWELRDCVCCWFDWKPIIWSFVDFKNRRTVISGKGTRRGGPLVFVGSLWVTVRMFPNHALLVENRYHSTCHYGTDFTACVFTYDCYVSRICSGRTSWKSQTNYTASHVFWSAHLYRYHTSVLT